VDYQGYSSSAVDDGMPEVVSTAPDKIKDFSWKICCNRLQLEEESRTFRLKKINIMLQTTDARGCS
jgi:hypothetical protein